MVSEIFKVKNRRFLNFVVVVVVLIVVVVVLIVVLVVVDLFCPRYSVSDYTKRYTTIIHSSFDLYN